MPVLEDRLDSRHRLAYDLVYCQSERREPHRRTQGCCIACSKVIRLSTSIVISPHTRAIHQQGFRAVCYKEYQDLAYTMDRAGGTLCFQIYSLCIHDCTMWVHPMGCFQQEAQTERPRMTKRRREDRDMVSLFGQPTR